MSDMVRSSFTSGFSDKEVIFTFAGETKIELIALKEMIEAETITSTVNRIYAMEEVVEAYRMVESEQRLGSVVMSII
jgi:D-arabinose 1-dehydrogenase-like Zn-dependent alcohol dehydrogenase